MTMRVRNRKRLLIGVALFFFSAMMIGCGGSNTALMGGAIQGKALSLTGTTSTLAGTAGTTGSTDATGAAAKFNVPYDITTDGKNLYVSDSLNNTIRKVVIATAAVTTLAGTASLTGGSSDGTGAAASFNYPNGITTDGTNLYVCDTGNNTIRKIVIATGAVTTLAGTPSLTGGSSDGTGAAASFLGPLDLTTDGANLYVSDTGNSTIRKIVIATGAVTTLAGTAGKIGSTDATGPAASFFFPYGITTDEINLYVCDTSNNTIRKIVIATGAVTTLAGTASLTGGSIDAIGPAASFNFPNDITTDGTNLYVADTGNGTIRQVVIATAAVTTLAGTAGKTGSTDATGAAAQFNRPYGITTDGKKLYLMDAEVNNTIRSIQ